MAQIAKKMRVSRSWVAALLTDPDGTKNAVRRESYRGRCESCGAATNGAAGPGKGPRRCRTCAAIEAGAARKLWTDRAVLKAIRAWRKEHGAPPRMEDWRAAGPGRPTTTTVVRMFGSWNAAMVAAKVKPRPQGAQPKEVS